MVCLFSNGLLVVHECVADNVASNNQGSRQNVIGTHLLSLIVHVLLVCQINCLQ